MSGMSRAEHLAWCKRRALEYVELGDLSSAVASMGSDLRKHPEMDYSATRMLTLIGMMEIQNGPVAVRRWIEGFN